MKDKLSGVYKSSLKHRSYHNSVKEPTDLLGHYLAGLIEGDGSIIVPKTVRNQSNFIYLISLSHEVEYMDRLAGPGVG